MRARQTVCLCAFALIVGSGSVSLADRQLGIDISSYQLDVTPAEWTQIYNSGRRFAFIKSTQGTTIIDSRFANNITRGPAAGILCGPYHFADPTNYYQPADGHTALDEANYFLATAGPYMTGGYLPPVLDLEQGSGLGQTGLSNWVNTFCNRILAVKGVRPIIYTSGSFCLNYLDNSVTQWDLWIANPNNADPQTFNPYDYQWPIWKFWQYSWTGSVPGITGDCDLDVFNGTLADLQAYAISGGTISRTPAALTSTVRAGSNAAAQSFTIRNSGTGYLNYSFTSDVSWASTNPASGTSTGENDTITVNYNVSALPVGIHTGTITINAFGASNSPQTVTLTMAITTPGDFDIDGDIDINDVNTFFSCYTGPSIAQTNPACQSADFDHDTDVDQTDFGMLQRCISGPAVTATLGCIP